MKRRALSLLMALALVLSFVPVSVFTAQEVAAAEPTQVTLRIEAVSSSVHAVANADGTQYTFTADLSIYTNNAFPLGSLQFDLKATDAIAVAFTPDTTTLPIAVADHTTETDTKVVTYLVAEGTALDDCFVLDATPVKIGTLTLTSAAPFSFSDDVKDSLLTRKMVNAVDPTAENGTTYEAVDTVVFGHSHEDDHADTVWTKWGDDEIEKTTVPSQSGCYYLVNDVTTSATVELKQGQNITLCLNGYTIEATGTAKLYKLTDDLSVATAQQQLTICDCSAYKNADGELVAGKLIPSNAEGGAVMVTASGTGKEVEGTTLTMRNVIIDGTGVSGTNNGIALFAGHASATIDIKDCVIKNCNTSKENGGGALYISSGSTLKAENILFYNNNSSNAAGIGGAIYVNKGTPNVTLKNCTFDSNKANLGAAVYMTTGNVTAENCTFDGNSASQGAALYMVNGTVAITDSTIKNNSGKISGGIINHQAGDLDLTRVTVEKNTITFSSDTYGGVIYTKAGTLDILECTFNENTTVRAAGTTKASYGAAIYFCGSVDMDIQDSVFTKNTAVTGGGAIASFNAATAMTMSGTTFKENSAANGGACFFKISKTDTAITSVSAEDCIFDGNTATNGGGGAILSEENLTLTRCELVNNTASTHGGAIYIQVGKNTQAPPTLNASNTIFKGNEQNGTTDYPGGSAIRSYKATVLLSKCQLLNNEAKGQAAIYITGASTGHQISETSFIGNKSTADSGGSALYNETSTTVKLVSCYIMGNTGSSGALYPSSTSAMVLSGSTVVLRNFNKSNVESNLYLTNKGSTTVSGVSQICIDGLTEGAAISATNATAKETAAALMYAVKTPTTWDNTWIRYENNGKYVAYGDDPATEDTAKVFYFVDGPAHSHNDSHTWTAITDALPYESGHYYLTKNVVLSDHHSLGDANVFDTDDNGEADAPAVNQDITICLNGFQISSSDETKRLFRLSNGNKLTICDCTEYTDNTGVYHAGKLIPSTGVKGGAVALYPKSTESAPTEFTLQGGVIDGSGKTGTLEGMAIHSSYATSASETICGIVNLKGGAIQNCTASAKGIVYATAYSRINISDTARIINNTATSGNGAAFNIASNTKFTMSGGKIEGNAATGGQAAAMQVDSAGCEVTITGGSISYNTSKNTGGAIRAYNGAKFTIEGTQQNPVIMKGNKSTNSNGGAIAYGSAMSVAPTLKWVDFSDNEANNGGALYLQKAGALIENCTFTNNAAKTTGGAIWSNANLTINGSAASPVTFTGNTATDAAGVFQSGQTVNVTNAVFTENEATVSGGALYVESSGTMNLNNVTVKDNVSKMGAVHLRNKKSKLNVTGKTSIIDNTNKDGDPLNVYLNYYAANGSEWGTIGMSAMDKDAKIGVTIGETKNGNGTDVVFGTTMQDATVDAVTPTDSTYVAGMVTLDNNYEGKLGLSNNITGNASVKTAMFFKASTSDGQIYSSAGNALAAENGVVTMRADSTEDVALTANGILDLNGYTITGTVSGAKELTLIDSATDDYDVEDGEGYGKITNVDEEVDLVSYQRVNGKRYIVLTDANGTHAHRIYAAVTAKALRAKDEGIGYTAKFGADQVLQAAITGYGMELSANNNTAVPMDVKTLNPARPFINGKELVFVITDFFVDGEDNNVRAGYEITGTPFVKVGNEKFSDTADTHRVTFKEMFNYADNNFNTDKVKEAARVAIYNLYKANANMMTAANGWNVTNVSQYNAQ